MTATSTKPLIASRTLRLLRKAEEIMQTPASDAKSIVYASRGLIIANLPHSDPKTNTWIRINGNYKLCIIAFPGEKIPYGVIPRLFLIWLVTEITRTKQREIVLGTHFSDFLNKIGYDDGGGYTSKRVKQQLVWLFRVAIGFFYDNKEVSEGVKPETIVDKYRLWWTDKKSDKQQQLFPSMIVVSQSLYEEVLKAPVPIDMRIVEKFRNSAMKLDLYMWLTYKMYSLKQPVMIKYGDLMRQFGANYTDRIDDDGKIKKKTALDNFRTKFRKEIKDVVAIYPVKVDIDSPRHVCLYPSKTSIPKTLKAVKKN